MQYKSKLKLFMAGMVLALVFTFFGCSNGEEDDTQGGVSSSEESNELSSSSEENKELSSSSEDAVAVSSSSLYSSSETVVESSSSSDEVLSSSSDEISSSSSEALESSSSVIELSSSSVEESSSSSEEISSSSEESGTFTDNRYPGREYKWVKIGNQIWMAENLKHSPDGGYHRCYNAQSNLEQNANCEKYGKLYDWATAKTVCPTNWHLPTQAEWRELFAFVEQDSECSSNSCTGKKLKAMTGWKKTIVGFQVIDENGTDDYGFAALPGGRLGTVGFERINEYGYWWSKTEDNDNSAERAYFATIYDDSSYNTDNAYWKNMLFSVRCVKD